MYQNLFSSLQRNGATFHSARNVIRGNALDNTQAGEQAMVDRPLRAFHITNVFETTKAKYMRYSTAPARQSLGHIPVEQEGDEGQGNEREGDPALLDREDAKHHDLVDKHADEDAVEDDWEEPPAGLVQRHRDVHRHVLVREPAKRKVRHDERQNDRRNGRVCEADGPDLRPTQWVSANAKSRKGQIQRRRLAHWHHLDDKVSEIG
jgi:hypothetical protein